VGIAAVAAAGGVRSYFFSVSVSFAFSI